MPDVRVGGAILTVAGDYKPGDRAPSGYLDWCEWAEIQFQAGLKQVECGRCGRWKFPQELSEKVDTIIGFDRRGRSVVVESPVCSACNVGDKEGV